jgi:hypothetical protein
VANIYFVQFIGVLITAAGIVALIASAKLYGTPLTREEQERSGQRGDSYRLPINLTTIASTAFFLGGMGILTWAKFEMYSFLNHWMSNLPEVMRIFLSCG